MHINLIFIIFGENNQVILTMLGMDKNRPSVIEGEYAKEMREAVHRKYTAQVSETEAKANTRSQKIKNEYNAVWK